MVTPPTRFATPADYVRACEECYELFKPFPKPETHEQLKALDRKHPPTSYGCGWADCVEAQAAWYSHRPSPPKPPEPDPPELEDDQKARLAWSLLRDEKFRATVKQLLGVA